MTRPAYSCAVNKCQMCYWRASSILFMPNGCNVLLGVLNEPLEPFLLSHVCYVRGQSR